MEESTKNEYRLENLTCANCAMKFENNIKTLPAVEEAMLILVLPNCRVVGDVTVEDLEKAGAFRWH